MNLRQAAQQALEAWFRPHGINYVDFKPYMEALKQALAEPEQGPLSLNNGRLTQYLDGSIGVGTPAEPEQEPTPGYCKHCKQYTIEEPLPAEPQTTHWEGCEAVHPECKKPEPVLVSPTTFIQTVLYKEDTIGRPTIWAQWPNEEKNT